MNAYSLQTQRQLEAFLAQIDIYNPIIDTTFHFSFPDHQLFIEWRHQQLWLTVLVRTKIDDLQLLALFECVFSRLTTKYLIRPFRVQGGIALNISLTDEATSERLMQVYQFMLRLLSPWKKRTHQ